MSTTDLQEALKEKEKEILRLQTDNTNLYQTGLYIESNFKPYD